MSYEDRVLANNNFDDIVPLTGCKTTRRTKLDDIKRENAYMSIMCNIGWSRFDYKGIPDDVARTLTPEMIERAVLCGAGVIYKVPESLYSASSGMWVCTPVDWIGVKKADNTSDDFITYLPNGDYAATGSYTKLGRNEIGNFVIVRNNFEQTSDYDFIEWTAQMLNETDISEMQLIKFARMIPIMRASDDSKIAQYENILKRVYNGEPYLVMSDPTKIMTKTPMSRDDSVLRLTDETAIERMHFLSEYHYELIRRVCVLYNIPFHTTSKSAQNLESEVHNMDIFSRMFTENGLRYRKMSEPDFKKAFGWDVKVELSPMFKKENEAIENNVFEPDKNGLLETNPDKRDDKNA